MLKTIRFPSLVSVITLGVCLAAPEMMGSNQAAAQGLQIQFGLGRSGYYNGFGRGHHQYRSGFGIGTGYSSPFAGYGYSSGYTGFGRGLYGYRSPSVYNYRSTNIYGNGFGASPYIYSPGLQFQGNAYGQNYNHSRIYNPYHP